MSALAMSGSGARGPMEHLLVRAGVVVAPLGVAAVVAVATWLGALAPLVVASAGALAFLVGSRRPALLLYAVAALIPVEDALSIPGLGTGTRLAGVLLAVVFLAARGRVPRIRTFPAAGWLFVGWALLTGFWALDPADWAASSLTLVQMVALALIAADLAADDPRVADRALATYAVASLGVVSLLYLSPAVIRGAFGARLAAFSGQDPAQLSAVLVPAVLFFVYQAARGASGDGRSRAMALLSLAAALVTAWGALVTGTRSALVGMAAGVVVIALAGTGRRGGRVAVALTAGAVGILAIADPQAWDDILARLAAAAATGGSGREDIWAVGMTIFGRNPVAGVGYSSFPAAFTNEAIRMTSLPGLDAASVVAGRAPHSLLVQVAGELGVVGLLFLGGLVVRVATLPTRDHAARLLRAALAGILAQALLLDVLERKQVWLHLGLALGLAAAAWARDRAATAEAGRLTAEAGRLTAEAGHPAPGPRAPGPAPQAGRA